MHKNINIIGYSGHSYVCIETAILNHKLIGGYYDLNMKNNNPYNIDYLGKENNVNSNVKVFICVADNYRRKKIYYQNDKMDFNINLIHPNSFISKTVEIDHQNLICSGVNINAQVKIGKGCIINTGSVIEHECVIEDFSHIAPGAILCGNVEVGKGSFIGANSVIKQGVKIGKNATIGAGAVVISDVIDNETVIGNPAKKI